MAGNPLDELGREPGESEFGYGRGIQESASQRGLVEGYSMEVDGLTPLQRLRAAHLTNTEENSLNDEYDEVTGMEGKYERES